MGEKILLFRRAFFALLFGSCLQFICAAAAGVETAATLTIENRQIVVLRARVLGRPAEERVQGAKSRIERALENGSAGVVTTRVTPQGVLIELDGAAVFGITDGDVNAMGNETPQSVADHAAKMLRQAIAEAHERNDTPRMLKSIALAIFSTALFAAAIYGLVRSVRRLLRWLSALHHRQMRDFKIANVVAINASQFFQLLSRIVIAVGWIIALALTHIWLSYVLVRFPYTRPWGEQLSGFLFRTALSILDAIARALPGLLTVAVILVIARFFSNLIAGFFERVKAQHLRIGWLDKDTAEPTRRIAIFIIWLFALAMAYPYLPAAHTDAFKGLSVLLGVMVSIGASGVVGQLASGMILLYARALRTGDFVVIGDIASGTVTEVGLLTTHIQTGTGDEIILPNAVIVANVTHNFSRLSCGENLFAMQATVTIGYNTPWRKVHALLLEAALRTDGVLPSPTPYVIQTALSDFYVSYRLVTYVGIQGPSQRMLAVNDLNAHIQDVFNEQGVQIMSPHYVIDPKQPVVVDIESRSDQH